MGEGIVGVIPFVFKIGKYDFDSDKEYFSPNFFDFYEKQIKDSNYIFTIRTEKFLPYYGDMLIEFYETIGKDLEQATKLTPESEHLKVKSFERFEELFSKSNRNSRSPFIVDSFLVSVLRCDTNYAWVFYSGSYKAYLEEYSTLLHFERIVAKSMKNPLAAIVKFGIIG
jgi:hypothetical protein